MGKNSALVRTLDEDGHQAMCLSWNLGCFTWVKLSGDDPSVVLAPALVKDLFTTQRGFGKAPQGQLGHELNGTVMVVVAGEELVVPFY